MYSIRIQEGGGGDEEMKDVEREREREGERGRESSDIGVVREKLVFFFLLASPSEWLELVDSSLCVMEALF